MLTEGGESGRDGDFGALAVGGSLKIEFRHWLNREVQRVFADMAVHIRDWAGLRERIVAKIERQRASEKVAESS